MINEEVKIDSAFIDDDILYGKKIVSTPAPKREIGVDTTGAFTKDAIDAAEEHKLDTAKIESFSQASQNRNTLYELLDTMAEDSEVASVLEIYSEDATEAADNGHIVFVESSDGNIAAYINYLLDSLNVDKYIYKWALCLVKYGDVYLRLYRKSDIEDSLFEDKNIKDNRESKNTLNEDLNIKIYSPNDKYEHYIEMVPNPAEMFELTKFGKTYAYIQADVTMAAYKNIDNLNASRLTYTFKKNDVNIYPATAFVHACLDDDTSRLPETVDIFLDQDNSNKLSYRVRRGQSILYPNYKTWREMMLLENSMLLNRITKSSIVRIIGVEVGDMAKEEIPGHLMGIKNMMEQKAAINTGISMTEYTNPGPMENNIYVPTKNGQGVITPQQVGGDVNVQGIADIDHFKNKWLSGLGIPKQYLNETDDSAGFNGGTSLSIISSRYAKKIKRIQNSLIQMITDCINLMLLDKGLDSYINKFAIKMVPPTTQEELDRRENTASKVQIASDILNLIGDVEDKISRLKILKEVLSSVLTDPAIIAIIEEQIEILENESEPPQEVENPIDNEESNIDIDINQPGSPATGNLSDGDSDLEVTATDQSGEETVASLPRPEDLGIDFTDYSNIE